MLVMRDVKIKPGLVIKFLVNKGVKITGFYRQLCCMKDLNGADVLKKSVRP